MFALPQAARALGRAVRVAIAFVPRLMWRFLRILLVVAGAGLGPLGMPPPPPPPPRPPVEQNDDDGDPPDGED